MNSRWLSFRTTCRSSLCHVPALSPTWSYSRSRMFILVNCVQQTFHDCSSDLTDKLTTSCTKNRWFWKIPSERMCEIFPPFSYPTLIASFPPFLFRRYSTIVKYLFLRFCVKCNMFDWNQFILSIFKITGHVTGPWRNIHHNEIQQQPTTSRIVLLKSESICSSTIF